MSFTQKIKTEVCEYFIFWYAERNVATCTSCSLKSHPALHTNDVIHTTQSCYFIVLILTGLATEGLEIVVFFTSPSSVSSGGE